MPELPEVEVTRRKLAPRVIDGRIARVRTTRPSYFFLTPPRTLARKLTGRVFTSLDRRGKYLLAGLDDGATLLLHLGMTGQLFTGGDAGVRLLASTRGGALTPETQRAFRPDRHTHLTLELAGRAPLYFRDVRKFGKVQWLAPGETSERIERLGPDALRARGARLFELGRGRRGAVKSFLLDQAVLAGVGNIYADEALFLAGVRPTRAAGKLTRSECDAIAKALVRVMRRSIATGGSSISDYVDPDGAPGRYQDERRVYGRRGAACLVCGTAIRHGVVGQRSTHHCPRCQR